MLIYVFGEFMGNFWKLFVNKGIRHDKNDEKESNFDYFCIILTDVRVNLEKFELMTHALQNSPSKPSKFNPKLTCG